MLVWVSDTFSHVIMNIKYILKCHLNYWINSVEQSLLGLFWYHKEVDLQLLNLVLSLHKGPKFLLPYLNFYSFPYTIMALFSVWWFVFPLCCFKQTRIPATSLYYLLSCVSSCGHRQSPSVLFSKMLLYYFSSEQWFPSSIVLKTAVLSVNRLIVMYI